MNNRTREQRTNAAVQDEMVIVVQEEYLDTPFCLFAHKMMMVILVVVTTYLESGIITKKCSLIILSS